LIKIIILTTILSLFGNGIAEDQVPEVTKERQQELHCLTLNIHYEARGESDKGKIAVAMVTLNRVRSSRFPDTICGVIKQRGQFSWYSKDKLNTEVRIDPRIKEIAYNVYIKNKYKDPTNGSLFFHNETVPVFNRVKFRTKIGKHLFYA
jgi:N-acetylmuramoyl-L-alanine amidase